MENNEFSEHKPCLNSRTLDHFITTSKSTSKFFLTVSLAIDPSANIFSFTCLSLNLPSAIFPSTTVSSAIVPSITFYPPANSTSDLRHINYKNIDGVLHNYIIVCY